MDIEATRVESNRYEAPALVVLASVEDIESQPTPNIDGGPTGNSGNGVLS